MLVISRLLEKRLAFQELCSMELDGSYMHRYVKKVCLVTPFKPQIAAGFVQYDGDGRVHCSGCISLFGKCSSF
jgi:hypothetical protein